MEKLSDQSRVILIERQNELIRSIEAFASIHETEAWKTLVELVFNKSVISLNKQLLNEAQAQTISTDKLYFLQGELKWAKQHSDINQFVSSLKRELTEIKKKLNDQ